MIIALYAAAAVIMAGGSLYFAWRDRGFRKFLAGAFFVSSGILFYLYLADVSVPLLGTGFVESPQISGGRSAVHFILFLVCFYFGFLKQPKA
ncbi:hypothetical protein [Bradyrhizobium iriomotense]|uniref:hypothetical protein n=1 Tax=Bradyrhizobium iriomotense TaxID=441950 RepID=UPI001B8A5319|nr:hypothetical protein [Bradyrhizobium iriomotense]MBR1133715.1 hypothetical protein [Bradyrhizobium iriomotense]